LPTKTVAPSESLQEQLGGVFYNYPNTGHVLSNSAKKERKRENTVICLHHDSKPDTFFLLQIIIFNIQTYVQHSHLKYPSKLSFFYMKDVQVTGKSMCMLIKHPSTLLTNLTKTKSEQHYK
jgi:hypothetical protein